MVLYLRTQTNKTIVDLEFWLKCEGGHNFHELMVAIDIARYSMFLLSADPVTQADIIREFNEIDELRGWMWECYYSNKRNIGSEEDYDEILNHLRKKFRHLASIFNLMFVED